MKMEEEDKYGASFENSTPTVEASIRKARLVSNIIERAEQSDEEENKGRS